METTHAIPTISQVLENGTLIELLYDPAGKRTALAIAAPDGRRSIQASYELPGGERLVPYGPTNSLIASECVLLPSDIGPPLGKDCLIFPRKSGRG